MFTYFSFLFSSYLIMKSLTPLRQQSLDPGFSVLPLASFTEINIDINVLEIQIKGEKDIIFNRRSLFNMYCCPFVCGLSVCHYKKCNWTLHGILSTRRSLLHEGNNTNNVGLS